MAFGGCVSVVRDISWDKWSTNTRQGIAWTSSSRGDHRMGPVRNSGSPARSWVCRSMPRGCWQRRRTSTWSSPRCSRWCVHAATGTRPCSGVWIRSAARCALAGCGAAPTGLGQSRCLTIFPSSANLRSAPANCAASSGLPAMCGRPLPFVVRVRSWLCRSSPEDGYMARSSCSATWTDRRRR